MIIEKKIKQTSNTVGYVTIPKILLLKEVEVIIDKKIIKKVTPKTNIIYFNKKYIGLRCYLNF